TISGSGSSTLTITTLSSTPAGSYPITITATSGTLAHATTVTLVVTGPSEFTLVVSPTARTISRGSSTTYSVNIGAVGSFSGTVSLTVSGLPKKTTSNFTLASITSASTSTLKVSANRTAATGTYALTINGTSGATANSTTVTLTIQQIDPR